MKSVYIHIPFCTNICTYCDFCKLYKNDKWIDSYLKALGKEIKNNYQGEEIKTLYIGGGTPSCLNINQLCCLFEIIKNFKLKKDCEITFECNAEDLTEDKLKFLQDKINRLSIGVQSFNPNILKVLGRQTPNIENIKKAKKYFKNINIDIMYGFNNQTIENLKSDIDLFLSLNIPHISAYNLILEPHTKLYIDKYKIDEDDTSKDEYLNKILTENGYHHYEVSNYAKKGYESKHNLVYWNNEEYYGFGLGASGYVNKVRYENTRNLSKYLTENYRNEAHKLTQNEMLQNEFILGFRKLEGINKKEFYKKYGFDILEIAPLPNLIAQGLLKNEDNIYINQKYLYLSNEILINFIDVNLHKH